MCLSPSVSSWALIWSLRSALFCSIFFFYTTFYSDLLKKWWYEAQVGFSFPNKSFILISLLQTGSTLGLDYFPKKGESVNIDMNGLSSSFLLLSLYSVILALHLDFYFSSIFSASLFSTLLAWFENPPRYDLSPTKGSRWKCFQKVKVFFMVYKIIFVLRWLIHYFV